MTWVVLLPRSLPHTQAASATPGEAVCLSLFLQFFEHHAFFITGQDHEKVQFVLFDTCLLQEVR